MKRVVLGTDANEPPTEGLAAHCQDYVAPHSVTHRRS